MTDLKFSILEALYTAERRRMSRGDMINLYLDNLTEWQKAVKDLIKDKYVGYENSKSVIVLKHLGVSAYESEKQRREDNAKQAAEKAAEQRAQAAQIEKDKKQQLRHDIVVSVISTLVGSLVTLLIEHFQEIINSISSLFS